MAKYKTVEKNGVTYYRTTFTHNGKKHDLTAKTTQDLDDKVQKKKQELSDNEIKSSTIKIEAWAVQWLETYKKPEVTAKNYNNYKGIIYNHIIPKIGNLMMKEVEQIHLQAFLNSLSNYSFAHVSYAKNTLTGMFSSAVTNNIIKRNPALGLSVSKKLSKGSHRVITQTEEDNLLKVCETHYFGLFPLIMLYCGLRNGEVTALQWGDIDLEKCIINVSKAIESGTRNSKSPKTKSGIRSIPIPDILVSRLKKEKQGKSDEDYVLTSLKGYVCTDKYASRYWENIKRHMDINMGATVKNNKITQSILSPEGQEDTFTPYCLRHTYCTNLFKAGVHINTAKYLMGHSSVKMVTEIYGHKTDDLTDKAKKQLNRYYKKDKSVTKSGSKFKFTKCIR